MKKVFLVAVMAVMLFSCSFSDIDTVDLKSTVSFTGTQFIVCNLDSFSYENTKFELNDDYILNVGTLNHGETYTVGMMQFADSKGNRFDFTKKPLKFTIWCDLNDDKNGFLYVNW